ncbi:questin oxidase family protein [Micromonospora sp. NBC_01655]|uniref:questin oxidase family protein n=1 Tax=Micromonospora sp. NBC_01655 TaxID=2975983 RepID=UPI0022553EEA|nr:questin oxidase family protein [Micromonospora sp. NBC_01655]MCX4472655.1 questin oxidase family protein [Micromonospora sp. NBC_01655]
MVAYFDAVNDALERLDDMGYERGERNELVNHGPMATETLATLGHGDQIGAWVQVYRAKPHHDRPAPHLPINASDEGSWRPALGDFGRAGDWEQLFVRELADAPWRDVVVRWWPRLISGLLAGITHGAIRTAHAVRSLAGTPKPSRAQLTELARGLAYWAARHRSLPGQAGFRGRASLAQAVAALPREQLEDSLLPPRARVISRERLRRIDELSGYDEALQAVAPEGPQLLLSEMTAEFAGIYLAHTDIYPIPLLHGVTLPAAVRIVLPYLPVEMHLPTVAAVWQLHVALLLAFTGDPRGEDTAREVALQADVPPFDELVARAVEHKDEHVIKFTEACLRENGLRPDPRYAAAVQTAQERIPVPELGLIP